MGIMQALWRLSKIAIVCASVGYVVMTLTMLAWTFTWSQTDPEGVQPADAIVCLGAGMGPNGGLDPAARLRVARCVDLHRAGVAPNIVFSGGTARSDGPSAGHQMGLYAQTLGLPGNAIIEEGRAQSTLQNALFSLELIPDADRLVIVTEAFHLPRAWASFKWAAYELNMEAPVFILDMSEQVRQHPNRAGVSWNLLGRESIAIWFNLGRAIVYSLAPDASIDLLK